LIVVRHPQARATCSLKRAPTSPYGKQRSTRRRTAREDGSRIPADLPTNFKISRSGLDWRATTDIKVIPSLHHFDCGVAKG
jgi:hypothetical protein